MFTAEEEAEMEAGALKIQAIARGRRQRRGDRRIGSAKKISNKKSEEEMASAKLQAIQRGRVGRRRVEEMREQRKSANKLQAIQVRLDTGFCRQATKQAKNTLSFKAWALTLYLFSNFASSNSIFSDPIPSISAAGRIDAGWKRKKRAVLSLRTKIFVLVFLSWPETLSLCLTRMQSWILPISSSNRSMRYRSIKMCRRL